MITKMNNSRAERACFRDSPHIRVAQIYAATYNTGARACGNFKSGNPAILAAKACGCDTNIEGNLHSVLSRQDCRTLAGDNPF